MTDSEKTASNGTYTVRSRLPSHAQREGGAHRHIHRPVAAAGAKDDARRVAALGAQLRQPRLGDRVLSGSAGVVRQAGTPLEAALRADCCFGWVRVVREGLLAKLQPQARSVTVAPLVLGKPLLTSVPRLYHVQHWTRLDCSKFWAMCHHSPLSKLYRCCGGCVRCNRGRTKQKAEQISTPRT